MARVKTQKKGNSAPSGLEQARDELFTHILRCGVIEAAAEHQKEWFDDTMEYLADRYTTLTLKELSEVRQVGEAYCRPVVRGDEAIVATVSDPETAAAATG